MGQGQGNGTDIFWNGFFAKVVRPLPKIQSANFSDLMMTLKEQGLAVNKSFLLLPGILLSHLVAGVVLSSVNFVCSLESILNL